MLIRDSKVNLTIIDEAPRLAESLFATLHARHSPAIFKYRESTCQWIPGVVEAVSGVFDGVAGVGERGIEGEDGGGGTRGLGGLRGTGDCSTYYSISPFKSWEAK